MCAVRGAVERAQVPHVLAHMHVCAVVRHMQLASQAAWMLVRQSMLTQQAYNLCRWLMPGDESLPALDYKCQELKVGSSHRY